MSAAASSRRRVVIESGTWRCRRRGAARPEVGGYGRDLAEKRMAQSFFWIRQALGQQECISDDAQRSVMMKSAPATTFEVVESEFLFEFLIVALDAPAQLGHPHQLPERGVGWQVHRKYLIGSGSSLGHSMSSHCSGRGVLRDWRSEERRVGKEC